MEATLDTNCNAKGFSYNQMHVVIIKEKISRMIQVVRILEMITYNKLQCCSERVNNCLQLEMYIYDFSLYEIPSTR